MKNDDYMTDLIRAGDFLEREFHHMKDEESITSFVKHRGIYYILNADNEFYPIDLEILLRTLINEFQMLYEVNELLKFDHIEPALFNEYGIVVESAMIDFLNER